MPAHVVNHDGLTALYDDGTGEVNVVESAEWTDIAEGESVEFVPSYTAANVHHGVAVADDEGKLFVTVGDSE